MKCVSTLFAAFSADASVALLLLSPPSERTTSIFCPSLFENCFEPATIASYSAVLPFARSWLIADVMTCRSVVRGASTLTRELNDTMATGISDGSLDTNADAAFLVAENVRLLIDLDLSITITTSGGDVGALFEVAVSGVPFSVTVTCPPDSTARRAEMGTTTEAVTVGNWEVSTCSMDGPVDADLMMLDG